MRERWVRFRAAVASTPRSVLGLLVGIGLCIGLAASDLSCRAAERALTYPASSAPLSGTPDLLR